MGSSSSVPNKNSESCIEYHEKSDKDTIFSRSSRPPEISQSPGRSRRLIGSVSELVTKSNSNITSEGLFPNIHKGKSLEVSTENKNGFSVNQEKLPILARKSTSSLQNSQIQLPSPPSSPSSQPTAIKNIRHFKQLFSDDESPSTNRYPHQGKQISTQQESRQKSMSSTNKYDSINTKAFDDDINNVETVTDLDLHHSGKHVVPCNTNGKVIDEHPLSKYFSTWSLMDVGITYQTCIILYLKTKNFNSLKEIAKILTDECDGQYLNCTENTATMYWNVTNNHTLLMAYGTLLLEILWSAREEFTIATLGVGNVYIMIVDGWFEPILVGEAIEQVKDVVSQSEVKKQERKIQTGLLSVSEEFIDIVRHSTYIQKLMLIELSSSGDDCYIVAFTCSLSKENLRGKIVINDENPGREIDYHVRLKTLKRLYIHDKIRNRNITILKVSINNILLPIHLESLMQIEFPIITQLIKNIQTIVNRLFGSIAFIQMQETKLEICAVFGVENQDFASQQALLASKKISKAYSSIVNFGRDLPTFVQSSECCICVHNRNCMLEILYAKSIPHFVIIGEGVRWIEYILAVKKSGIYCNYGILPSIATLLDNIDIKSISKDEKEAVEIVSTCTKVWIPREEKQFIKKMILDAPNSKYSQLIYLYGNACSPLENIKTWVLKKAIQSNWSFFYCEGSPNNKADALHVFKLPLIKIFSSYIDTHDELFDVESIQKVLRYLCPQWYGMAPSLGIFLPIIHECKWHPIPFSLLATIIVDIITSHICNSQDSSNIVFFIHQYHWIDDRSQFVLLQCIQKLRCCHVKLLLTCSSMEYFVTLQETTSISVCHALTASISDSGKKEYIHHCSKYLDTSDESILEVASQLAVEGIPFLNKEYILDYVRKTLPTIQPPADKPWMMYTLEDTIRSKLLYLSNLEIEILYAASIIGEYFNLNTLLEVLSAQSLFTVIFDGILNLIREGILQCTISLNSRKLSMYSFRNSCIRDIIYNLIPTKLKLEYHSIHFEKNLRNSANFCNLSQIAHHSYYISSEIVDLEIALETVSAHCSLSGLLLHIEALDDANMIWKRGKEIFEKIVLNNNGSVSIETIRELEVLLYNTGAWISFWLYGTTEQCRQYSIQCRDACNLNVTSEIEKYVQQGILLTLIDEASTMELLNDVLPFINELKHEKILFDRLFTWHSFRKATYLLYTSFKDQYMLAIDILSKEVCTLNQNCMTGDEWQIDIQSRSLFLCIFIQYSTAKNWDKCSQLLEKLQNRRPFFESQFRDHYSGITNLAYLNMVCTMLYLYLDFCNQDCFNKSFKCEQIIGNMKELCDHLPKHLAYWKATSSILILILEKLCAKCTGQNEDFCQDLVGWYDKFEFHFSNANNPFFSSLSLERMLLRYIVLCTLLRFNDYNLAESVMHRNFPPVVEWMQPLQILIDSIIFWKQQSTIDPHDKHDNDSKKYILLGQLHLVRRKLLHAYEIAKKCEQVNLQWLILRVFTKFENNIQRQNLTQPTHIQNSLLQTFSREEELLIALHSNLTKSLNELEEKIEKVKIHLANIKHRTIPFEEVVENTKKALESFQTKHHDQNSILDQKAQQAILQMQEANEKVLTLTYSDLAELKAIRTPSIDILLPIECLCVILEIGITIPVPNRRFEHKMDRILDHWIPLRKYMGNLSIFHSLATMSTSTISKKKFKYLHKVSKHPIFYSFQCNNESRDEDGNPKNDLESIKEHHYKAVTIFYEWLYALLHMQSVEKLIKKANKRNKISIENVEILHKKLKLAESFTKQLQSEYDINNQKLAFMLKEKKNLFEELNQVGGKKLKWGATMHALHHLKQFNVPDIPNLTIEEKKYRKELYRQRPLYVQSFTPLHPEFC